MTMICHTWRMLLPRWTGGRVPRAAPWPATTCQSSGSVFWTANQQTAAGPHPEWPTAGGKRLHSCCCFPRTRVPFQTASPIRPEGDLELLPASLALVWLHWSSGCPVNFLAAICFPFRNALQLFSLFLGFFPPSKYSLSELMLSHHATDCVCLFSVTKLQYLQMKYAQIWRMSLSSNFPRVLRECSIQDTLIPTVIREERVSPHEVHVRHRVKNRCGHWPCV